MADGEEDFSLLPLTERWVHKNWKARKSAYEHGAKAFASAMDESDPLVRQFINEPNLWKSAASDSNVAAHQDALNALSAFLNVAGTLGCTRCVHAGRVWPC
jgi:cytoskeleton-associated protein 5